MTTKHHAPVGKCVKIPGQRPESSTSAPAARQPEEPPSWPEQRRELADYVRSFGQSFAEKESLARGLVLEAAFRISLCETAEDFLKLQAAVTTVHHCFKRVTGIHYGPRGEVNLVMYSPYPQRAEPLKETEPFGYPDLGF